MAEKKKSKKSAEEEGDVWGDYESPEQEALRKAQNRVKEGGAKFQGRPYLDPSYELMVTKDGDNSIRIVPPIEARELGMFGLDLFLHRNVGPNREVFLCLKNMWGEYCPRCAKQTPELWEKAKENSEEGKAAKAEAVSYFPEYKILTWVIDRSDNVDQLKLFPMPKSIAEEILTQSNRKDTQVMLDVAHPREGRDIYFTRYKDKDFTKYKGIQIGERATPLPAWAAEQRKRLDEVLIKPDPEEFALVESQTGKAAPASAEDGAVAPTVTTEDDGKDELDRMDMDGLKALIKDLSLGIRVRKGWTEEDVRVEIRKAIEPDTDADSPQETSAEPSAEAEEEEEAAAGVDREKVPDDLADCFGMDFDEYEECDTCPEPWRGWCEEESEKARKEAEAQEAKKTTTPAKESSTQPRGEDSKAVNREEILAKIKAKMGKED